MLTILTLLALGGGIAFILFGLILIAPQVRIHQIEIYSLGSWVFRAGIGLSLLAVVVMAGTGVLQELESISLWAGLAALLGGLFVWNHERAQALHDGAETWDWQQSLTLQMMSSGAVLTLMAAVLVLT
ncbi:MAG: hypothetical protein GYB68_19620 [Chloroflexi bacterium]|nr:hypothetical protein [Chloroflexota bacterium]